MAMMPDILKFLTDRLGLNPTNDTMERSPSELGTESADSGVISGDKVTQARTQDNSHNVTSDSGKIVDFSPGNPFAGMFKDTKQMDGSIMGLLRSMGLADQKLMQPGTPKVGGGDPSVTPGQGQDAALNPTPLAKQRQRGLMRPMPGAPDPNFPIENTTTVPKDYSQPTALDPQGIEELRTSLLTQAGQLNPNNPNGLAGRMSGPYSKLDQASGMSDAQVHADELNASKVSTRADRRNTKPASEDANDGPPISIRNTERLAPPRLSDYAREFANTRGVVAPFPDISKPQTTEGLLEAIVGLEPQTQVLRGLKDVLDTLGITKKMRSYPSKIDLPHEEKA